MSEWAQKRFWKDVAVSEMDDGYSIQLDGRVVKTPLKRTMSLPTKKLAAAIAGEWDEQDGVVDPTSMPFTRSANAAIDKVADQRTEVAALIAAYGETDLLCYFAEGPDALIERQEAGWRPYLDWAESALGARLKTGAGVMHVPQSAGATARLSEAVHDLRIFSLTAFHDMVALTGSLVLGLSAAHGHSSPEEIWAISRIDEDWQSEQWGEDDEAMTMSAAKKAAFLHACRFFRLANGH